ncbi:MAG: GNAT family N-acetyltransferase [Anaerolineae bacterium]|nr:GNAT family N-acetyltransferase [Anaerolineae bacterium]
MIVHIEPYDPAKHDKHAVAELIYGSDPSLNALVYGAGLEGVAVIERLVGIPDSYFCPAHTRCALLDGEIVGVIVGFPVSRKQQVDNASGRAFMQAMGAWRFLKRLPMFVRMAKLIVGEMDPAGYYIHTISISPAHQRCGIGTRLIEAAAEGQSALYLHVNMENQQAIGFYEKIGFQPKSHAKIKLHGRDAGQYLMEKRV